MKAILCKQHGSPSTLVLEDIPSLEPGPGEVVITMRAASLNFPDLLIIENRYQVKPPLPFSPGSELAGVVARVGDGVTRVKPGDRVMAVTTHGAFAEEAKTSESRVLPIPDGMTFEVAAAFGLTYATSDHALSDRGTLKAGETLLVLGAAGGVGLAAVEIGKALGARVIACASSEEKLRVCREHGADETIDYAREDLRERARALTEGRGPDVIYDPVGGALSEPAFRSIAWRGRHLVVGFAAGDIPRLPLNLALLKGAAVVGVFWGDFARREPDRLAQGLQQLARWHEEGRLRPHISRTFTLAQAPEALKLMAGCSVTGKVVLRV